MKLKPGFPREPKILEMPVSWDPFPGKLLTRSGTSLRGRSMMHSTKVKGVGDLKNVLI